MTDIAERLRVAAVLVEGSDDLSLSGTPNVCRDAADEIERLWQQLVSDINAEEKIDQLESEIGWLRAALEAMVDRWEPDADGGQDRIMWENAKKALGND